MTAFTVSSAEWPGQKAVLEERIDELHVELETLRGDDAAMVQGRIAELRWLIDKAEPSFRPGTGSAKYT